jgi:hypothetical protein
LLVFTTIAVAGVAAEAAVAAASEYGSSACINHKVSLKVQQLMPGTGKALGSPAAVV